MIKKIILLSTVAMLPSFAFADAKTNENKINVKLGGSLDTQMGFVKQSESYRYENGTNKKLRNNALVNNGKVKINVDASTDSDFKYGAMLEFNANTSASKTENTNVLNKSMMYVESSLGKLEVGSSSGLAAQFRENTLDKLAVATGGAWDGDVLFWINGKTANGLANDDVYILTPDLVVAHDAIGSSNKISYISPRWNGFQFGLTYLPDAMAKGTVTGIMKYPSKTYSNTEIALNDNDPSFKPGFRNVYDLAISYETKINQIDLSSFINGEIGTSKNFEDSSGKLYTRKPLRAWEGGASLTFQNFTVGASYGNWGVSGIYKGTSHNYKRHSSFYTLGAGYSMGDLSTAITYFNSRAAGGVTGITQQDKDDKVKLLSFAVQYKLMPGFMPYAEVTNFNLSQHSQVTNKGYISLIGAKISF